MELVCEIMRVCRLCVHCVQYLKARRDELFRHVISPFIFLLGVFPNLTYKVCLNKKKSCTPHLLRNMRIICYLMGFKEEHKTSNVGIHVNYYVCIVSGHLISFQSTIISSLFPDSPLSLTAP